MRIWTFIILLVESGINQNRHGPKIGFLDFRHVYIYLKGFYYTRKTGKAQNAQFITLLNLHQKNMKFLV